ncbi:hypothetical protein GCM10010404_68170 [Nonomuraea africana]
MAGRRAPGVAVFGAELPEQEGGERYHADCGRYGGKEGKHDANLSDYRASRREHAKISRVACREVRRPLRPRGMKYLLMIYANPETWVALTDEQRRRLNEMIREDSEEECQA